MALLELQVDEIFTIDKGLRAIEKELARHKSLDLVNIPLPLIRQWKPFLEGKKITLYNNFPDPLPPDIESLVHEVHTTVRMKGTLYGRVVDKGEIFVKNRIFNIWFEGEEILNIGSVTYRRCVKCIQAMHRDIILSEQMDTLNIMTLYEPGPGVKAILDAVKTASRVRIVNLPRFLVRHIVIHLDADDVKILCAEMTEQARKVARRKQARVSGGLLNAYSRYKGKRLKSGGIALNESFFSVNYLDEKIYYIRSIDWPRCPNCMTDFYELGWRAARRVK